MCSDRSHPRHAQSCLQVARARKPTPFTSSEATLSLARPSSQVNTLSLVGVSHLFVVPRIRTSAYVSMLAQAFPSLANSSPGSIEEPSLPDLRHVVVIDNTPSLKDFQTQLENVKCAVDFRETLVWQGHASEDSEVRKLQSSLQKDDIINLQFTR